MFHSFFSIRRGLAAGGVVLLLTGSAVGVAAAQSAPGGTSAQSAPAQANNQAYLNALAARLGIDPTALQTAMSQARSDVGEPTPGSGTAVGGPAARAGQGGRGGAQNLNVAAQVIGIPLTQLQQELPGSSLTQVAQAHGADPAVVATALKTAADQRVDQQMTQVQPAPAPATSADSSNGSGTPTTSASPSPGQVIPFTRGQPSPTQAVGQIPSSYVQGQGTIVTGAAADTATAAAVAAYPGGTVDRVVLLSSGDYEVHMIAVNWPHHVFVNSNFTVIGAE
jgi:hypothetical protein